MFHQLQWANICRACFDRSGPGNGFVFAERLEPNRTRTSRTDTTIPTDVTFFLSRKKRTSLGPLKQTPHINHKTERCFRMSLFKTFWVVSISYQCKNIIIPCRPTLKTTPLPHAFRFPRLPALGGLNSTWQQTRGRRSSGWDGWFGGLIC